MTLSSSSSFSLSASPTFPSKIDCFTVRHLIGTGSFATVWLGEHPPSRIRVAIKSVPVSSFEDNDMRTRFVREVTLMKQMDHPFIGKLYQVIETSDSVHLVQEYVENGTLFSYVNQHERLSELHARRLFSQILSALEYIHEEKLVVHRDIKAENVLLDVNWNIRLIDFGLSHAFTANNPNLHTACGSPAYAAPEMIVGQPYTKAADVWSAGILLYAMVAGELPFDDPGGVQGILMKIVSSEPAYPEVMSSALIDLLRRILMKAPEMRIEIARIKAHPWFSHSEYLRIFQIPFSEEEWLVRGVDRGIVDEMERMGIDVKCVAEAVLCGEYTTETAVYSMLRRRKITERVHEVMEELANAMMAGGIGQSSSVMTGMRKVTANERGTVIRRPAQVLGKRRESSIVSVRRGSIVGGAQVASPLVVQQAPMIVKPRTVDSVRRVRSGTLQ